ncbi:MAG: N-acetylglucosamine-6-phosphate deacetylase [Synergistetes bacterium]|nr:N-acetylglucosamine-6-phosphate deacetylase [Synergistota bacterium]
MNAIVNARLVTTDSIREGWVVVYDKKIVDIVPLDTSNLNGLNVIDAGGMYLSAGFIDTHIHGIAGRDVMDATPDALSDMSISLSSVGVTSFLPTTVSMEWRAIRGALDNIRVAKNIVEGANILGVHLEGPFINPIHAGAQDAKNIIRPDYTLLREYRDLVKLITYAPEMDEDMSFTREALMDDICLSVGHTDADYEEAMRAIALGVSRATHLFNGMRRFHHRDIGVLGAVLMSNSVYCELVADNLHLSPEVYALIVKLKGKERVILVSDSVRAALMEKGSYKLGAKKVFYDGLSVRLEDGTLAGSTLTLNRAVFNFWKATGLPLHEVISMATLNPAVSIGIMDKGSLSVGKDADMVVFDENLDVYLTVIGGEIKHRRRGS